MAGDRETPRPKSGKNSPSSSHPPSIHCCCVPHSVLRHLLLALCCCWRCYHRRSLVAYTLFVAHLPARQLQRTLTPLSPSSKRALLRPSRLGPSRTSFPRDYFFSLAHTECALSIIPTPAIITIIERECTSGCNTPLESIAVSDGGDHFSTTITPRHSRHSFAQSLLARKPHSTTRPIRRRTRRTQSRLLSIHQTHTTHIPCS